MTQVPTLGSISKSSHYSASVESAQLDKEKSVLTHQLDLWEIWRLLELENQVDTQAKRINWTQQLKLMRVGWGQVKLGDTNDSAN